MKTTPVKNDVGGMRLIGDPKTNPVVPYSPGQPHRTVKNPVSGKPVPKSRTAFKTKKKSVKLIGTKVK
jgi:hypothetical protein